MLLDDSHISWNISDGRLTEETDFYIDQHSPDRHDSLAIYKRELGKCEPLSNEEEFRYGRKWKEEGDKEAYEKLITHNLRYVVKVAFSCSKRWNIPKTKIPDMIQAGNEALLNAAKREKYDYKRGQRLARFAIEIIKRYISDFLNDDKGSVLIKRNTRADIHNIEVARKYLSLTNRLNDYALSELTGLSLYKIKERDKVAGYTHESINETWDDGGNGNGKGQSQRNNRTIREPVDTAILPDACFDGEGIMTDINEVLGMVNEKERYILKEHFLGERTLKDIGEEDFGQTRANASRIKNLAVDSIRENLMKDPNLMERLLGYSWELANDKLLPSDRTGY